MILSPEQIEQIRARDAQFDDTDKCACESCVQERDRRALLAHLDALQKSEARWVPVTERLPKSCDHVLMVFDDSYGGAYLIGWREDDGRWFVDDQESNEAYGITHWMPLPSPPEAS